MVEVINKPGRVLCRRIDNLTKVTGKYYLNPEHRERAKVTKTRQFYFSSLNIRKMELGTKEKDFYLRRPIPASFEFEQEHFGKNNVWQTEIDFLRRKVNIVNIIGTYVKLRKKSKNSRFHVGLCPFHSEKTPSFHVSHNNNFFHCFGCGEGGDVIKFIEIFHRVDFADAIKILKKAYKIKSRIGKVYKGKFFEEIIDDYEYNFGDEELFYGIQYENLVFLQDEISQRVRDLVYQKREEEYIKLHGKSYEEIINQNTADKKLSQKKKKANSGYSHKRAMSTIV